MAWCVCTPVRAEYPQKLLFASDPLDGPRYRQIEMLERAAAPGTAPPGRTTVRDALVPALERPLRNQLQAIFSKT